MGAALCRSQGTASSCDPRSSRNPAAVKSASRSLPVAFLTAAAALPSLDTLASSNDSVNGAIVTANRLRRLSAIANASKPPSLSSNASFRRSSWPQCVVTGAVGDSSPGAGAAVSAFVQGTNFARMSVDTRATRKAGEQFTGPFPGAGMAPGRYPARSGSARDGSHHGTTVMDVFHSISRRIRGRSASRPAPQQRDEGTAALDATTAARIAPPPMLAVQQRRAGTGSEAVPPAGPIAHNARQPIPNVFRAALESNGVMKPPVLSLALSAGEASSQSAGHNDAVHRNPTFDGDALRSALSRQGSVGRIRVQSKASMRATSSSRTAVPDEEQQKTIRGLKTMCDQSFDVINALMAENIALKARLAELDSQ